METRFSKQIRSGIGQLTLVEHSLCPLDARTSVSRNLEHRATFSYSDKNGFRRNGEARVHCPLGLSPKDEFYLWGLLAITLSDPNTDGELHATRHHCLRRLGLIDANRRRGGRQYQDFSLAIERLSSVRYQCDRFYDPIRAEHRRISFGFFSYSIPIDDESCRAWRFVWDPIFFELVKATGGSLRFDLRIYLRLRPATRRLYLFVAKLFFRKSTTQRLNVVEVAEQIIGIAPTVGIRNKKAKLSQCVNELIDQGIVSDSRFIRVAKGRFDVVLRRGLKYRRRIQEPMFESPLIEPLADLGFDPAGVDRLLQRYDHRQIREWVDITLAARARFGSTFFRKGAPAYLTDNLKNATAGRRTPPDWWAELRTEESRARGNRRLDTEQRTRDAEEIASKSLTVLGDVHDSMFDHFVAMGQSEDVARANADQYRRARQQKLIPK